MKTISQRELRNDNAKIIRGVEAGETYTVTRRGVPVAEVGPVGSSSGLRLLKPATKSIKDLDLTPAEYTRTSSEILDDLREDRL